MSLNPAVAGSVAGPVALVDVAIDENDVDSESAAITSSMLAAQNEADMQVDKAELEDTEEAKHKPMEKENEVLPPVPKLLALSQDKLIKKTTDLKEKGNQLDLLLLKAESYSHFIKENQDRCRTALSAPKSSPQASGKGKRAKTSSLSSPSSPALGGFTQPSNLCGGQLMKHQLEGLQWLLSLWENGLSGILADEMGLGTVLCAVLLDSLSALVCDAVCVVSQARPSK